LENALMIGLSLTAFIPLLIAAAQPAVAQAALAQPQARIVLAQVNPAIGGAMTEQQARRSCRMELRGTRDTRRGRAARMEICMRGKMVGGR
jgi:hypothetical protein